jgi:hypothetical protein
MAKLFDHAHRQAVAIDRNEMEGKAMCLAFLAYFLGQGLAVFLEVGPVADDGRKTIGRDVGDVLGPDLSCDGAGLAHAAYRHVVSPSAAGPERARM